MMETALAHPYDYSLTIDEALQAIADAGFRLISIGADREHSRYHTPEGKKALKELLSTTGLKIQNIHAPIEQDPYISSLDEQTRQSGVEKIIAAIDACRHFDCGMIVIHLAHRSSEKEHPSRLEAVRRSFRELIPIAEKTGVKIACENVWDAGANRLLRNILDEFRHPNIGLCYDSSHANLTDDPGYFPREYAGRLFITHLSDNRGKEDDHLLPGMGIINWTQITGAIKKTGFQGPLLLEVERASSGYGNKPPVDFTMQAYIQAEWLLEMMD